MLDLMIPPIVAALVILSIHAYLGLHVIAREVIFIDLAFAQIAALGTTVALLMGIESGTTMSLLFALGFTLLGALLFSLTRMEKSAVPQEAIIGVSYVVASAAVILLASLTAEGSDHLRETLTGTLIWVNWPTIGKIAGVYTAVGLFHYVLRRKFLALTFAPERVGNIRLWDFVFYVTFGIVISLSVEIAGVLMVFTGLVIPAVIAFLYTNRFGLALLIAWGAGTLAILSGIGASFYWDLATGPLLVCTFGVTLIVAAVLRPLLGIRPDREIVVASLELDD
ncbi:MAG TPA: metal ABC transporter permease [Gemmatimonadetes bacterium]|jgi:zinc/manganese transport system permease protein|nr:metal ABC transporter permease [Gemmatimonadota bacterium]HIA73982.1 metal ABC transporter permease [Gemmatimonadota bacterium]HIB09633.1 metal ABC transporter permease [Gemmatimonadota bacterium]HIN79170.1 metal ABC transporter permease [Gemmatimonadota bacterium]